MPTDRARQSTADKTSRIVPDEFARQTEEQAALASALIELARELCETATQLNRIVRLACISKPTPD